MDPNEVKYFNDGEKAFPVEIIINDYQGLAIGSVEIKSIKYTVIRWNGNDNKHIGFPQSRGNPVWMILPKGLKISIELQKQGE